MGRLLLVWATALVAAFAFGSAHAQSAEFTRQSDQYRAACETLGAPNIDCVCVGKMHATWAHLSPTPEYATYLYQTYRKNVGLTHTQDEALNQTVESLGGEQGFMMSEANSFEPVSDADPFQYESARGCVIAEAPRPSVPDIPAGTAFAEYVEQAQISLGWEKYPKCVAGEYMKMFDEPSFDAHLRRTRFGHPAEQIAAEMGRSVEQVEALIASASNIHAEMGKTLPDPTMYCMARLAAEDYSTGELRLNYARSAQARLGKPVGLESIDVTRPPPEPVDQMAAAMAEMEAVRAEMAGAPSREELLAEIENSPEFQQAQRMQAGGDVQVSDAEMDAACKGSGYDAPFCSCFVEDFNAKIAPQAGESAGALMAIAIGQGLNGEKTVQLIQKADSSVMARMAPQMTELVQACEAKSTKAGVDAVLNAGGTAKEQYERICLHNDPDNGAFCSCAASHLDSQLNAQEMSILVRLEGASLTDTEFAEIAGEMGMTEEQAGMALAQNPRLMQATMGLMSACF